LLDHSPYDTAWVAAVPAPGQPLQPRFPAAFGWLLEHQRTDGSWGGPIAYQPDRLICTLAALRALVRFTARPGVQRAIEAGRGYVWAHAHELGQESCEPVGLELLLPSLRQQVADAGIDLPEALNVFQEERVRKLAMIPPSLLYSPSVTLSHSLEFLGGEASVEGLLAAQSPNGSLGNSPSATAFLLERTGNPAAERYLEACLEANGGTAVPALYPCATFESLWRAYHLWLRPGVRPDALLTAGEFAALRSKLERGEGIGLDDSFPIADADDTAVAIVLLTARGDDVSPSALQRFEAPGGYVSFPYERHPSVGVNVHVLDAFLHLPVNAENEARIAKLLGFLQDHRTGGTYWLDKWHVSPYYATAHVVAVLSQLDRERWDCLCGPALEWIRSTQRDDGGWGAYQPATAEETAYAVVALARAAAGGEADRERIQRGAAFIRSRRSEGESSHPPLWIDKCLYCPTRVVDAIIETALALAL
jgi:halimadienyl-diphosphate synthase